MLAVGILIIVAAILTASKQQVVRDAQGNPVITEIELFGYKVKTPTASVSLCVLGAVVVWVASDLMKTSIERSQPKLVTFKGEVDIDSRIVPEIQSFMVGVTSGSWVYTATPNPDTLKVPVAITVPNSWPSYSAYVLVPGSAKVRPMILGTSLEEPKFNLKIGP
jgi:hypothetical protein